MRTCLALVLTACLATSAAHAQKRPITHEDIILLKRTGEAKPSPDGKWILFTLTEPAYDPSKAVSDLWIIPTDGTTPARRLTNTKSPEGAPAWSPDSTRIAFSARREGDQATQIYILPVSGGEAERMTSLPSGALNPQWRPDGRSLLFESMIQGKRQTPEKSTARVYDSMPVRYWNVWLDDTKPHIFTFEPGKEPVDILASAALLNSPGFGGLASGLSSERTLQAIWSPDGKEILFTAEVNRNAIMFEETESHLFRVNAAGGEPVQITKPGQSFSRPRFSPDGKYLLALHQTSPTKTRLYSLSRLARLSWPTPGEPVLLTQGWDRSVGSFSFTPDGRGVVFDAEDEGFSKPFRVSINGGGVEKLMEVREGGYAAPQYAGRRLIAMYSASTMPTEVAAIENGGHRLLTSFNAERLAQLDLPKPEHFWFTDKNGRRVHSVIAFPPALDRTRKYPLVVFPHGGPNAMSADAFSTRWNYHLLTSPGYVLLMTNYTGSTGFGEKFADDIERDVLRGPAQEILEAIEEAIKKYPFIDGSRQAAIGASYGGYLMNWLNGQTNQFRCFVNHAGATNNESQYGLNDGGFGRELRMGAPVWETGKGQWMDQSPFRYAASWKTPMLLTQGEIDYRVPISESMMTFKILQRKRIPSRLVVFPDEGHWILKPENNKHHMQEVLGWLKKYLEP